MKLLRSGGIAKRIPRTLRVRRGPVVPPVRSDYAERMSNGPPHASPGLVALVVGEGRFADRVQIAYRTSNRRVLRNRSTAGGRRAGARRHTMTGAAKGRGRNPTAINHAARMARRFHGSLACRLATAPRNASALRKSF